jgi:hypothetical protein
MDSSNVEYYYSNAGETQTWLRAYVKCRWFFDAPERLYQKVGLDTIYYPRAPGRPSRNALMKFDRSLGRLLTPGIPASAERATVEGTDHLLWLTGHSPSSAATIEVIGQTLQDRLSRLAPATSWAVTRPCHG